MANDGTVKIGTELDDSGFKSGLSKLGSVASGALKGTVAAVGSVATAASGAVAGLLALESATEEYRVAQGKLNTAFEAAGYGPEAAAQAYNDFFGILGDTDTATEASQLLAKLADNQEDLSTWTRIAAGVNGTFGDSLPIEGLIEASNETAKVGTVTGVLADALNWAGISEDEFNAKLAECSDESERNQLIMDTLSTTYDEASDAFYRNNEALVAAREEQAQMDSALAELGGAVSDVKTRMIGEFLPAVSQVTSGIAGMLTGTEGAKEQFSSGIGSLIDSAVERLPEFLDFGVQIITSIAEGLISNLPAIIEAVPQIVTSIREAIVELYPTIMDSGAEILMQIANGILGAIPDMLEALPDVIVSLLDFFVENFPKIADAGGDLLAELISGIIGAIPELVAALPEIINAIINGIGALMSGIVEIGADIVRGIWEGILSVADWITEKVKGFFGGIVDSVKGLLGIHSPSTVFRDQIGKNIGLGIAEGIDASIPMVEESMQGLNESLIGSANANEVSTEFELQTNASGAVESGLFLAESIASGIENGKQGIIDAAVSAAKSAIQAAQAVMAQFMPIATSSVSAVNSSMTPVSATTPRFSAENAIASAAGMMAMSQLAGSGREVVFTLDGTEFARAIIPDIRAVESQSPAIVSD